MGAFRKITTGILASTLLATAMSPAMADWGHGNWGGERGGWGGGRGYGYGYDSYRHHDHDDAGPIIAGILGIGLIAAIAASSADHHDRQYQQYSAPPPSPPYQGQDDGQYSGPYNGK